MLRTDADNPGVNERGELLTEAERAKAGKPAPVGPVNERGELINTPVHGLRPHTPQGREAEMPFRQGVTPVNERGEPLNTPVIAKPKFSTLTEADRAVLLGGDGGALAEPVPSDLMPAEPTEPIIEGTNMLPMPEVGEPVRYHLGPGDFRGGSSVFPALVTKVDAERRQVGCIVFFEAQESVDQYGVAERRGGERGFERVVPPGLMRNPTLLAEAAVFAGRAALPAAEVPAPAPPVAEPLDEATAKQLSDMVIAAMDVRVAEAIKAQMAAFIGPFEVPEGGVISVLDEYETRISKLEAAAKPKKTRAKKAKAGTKK